MIVTPVSAQTRRMISHNAYRPHLGTPWTGISAPRRDGSNDV